MSAVRPKPLFWIALTVLIVGAGLFMSTLFGPASNVGRGVSVTIPRGASAARVAGILKQRGVINNPLAFRLAARLNGGSDVKAGTYTLSPSMSPAQILTRLREGAREPTVRATFPEGYRLEQMAERAGTLPGVRSDEFLRLAGMRGGAFSSRLRLPSSLEGYLFPDTYEFRPTDTAEDVIKAMVGTFESKVAETFARELRASAAKGRNLHEIVTIASLIEREARVKEEQARIAGVIYNRLEKRMPLQIDATVQYVIGHRERLLYRDLEVKSPYNTYKNVGLPPGPICSPGLGAIRAALHPEKVNFLYYTARPDGSHTFTTTYEDHLRATRDARAEGR